MTLVTATRSAVAVLIGTRIARRRTTPIEPARPLEVADHDQPTQAIPVPDLLADRPDEMAPDA